MDRINSHFLCNVYGDHKLHARTQLQASVPGSFDPSLARGQFQLHVNVSGGKVNCPCDTEAFVDWMFTSKLDLCKGGNFSTAIE